MRCDEPSQCFIVSFIALVAIIEFPTQNKHRAFRNMPPYNQYDPSSLMARMISMVDDEPSISLTNTAGAASVGGRGGKRKLSEYTTTTTTTTTTNSPSERMSEATYYGGCIESSLRRLEHSSSRSGAFHMEHGGAAARFYASTLLQDPQQFILPRLERSYWKQVSTTAKEQISRCLEELLNQKRNSQQQSSDPHHGGWKFQGFTRDLPVFQCPTTQLQFTLIPGGNYRKGMSLSLQDQFHRCLLEHFRVSSLQQELPLEIFRQVQQILQHLQLDDHHQQPMMETAANTSVSTCRVAPFLLATAPTSYYQTKLALRSPVEDQENHFAFPNKDSVAPVGGTILFRLPTEWEWEYAARGGGWEMLFPYSCQIDDEKQERNQHHSNQLGPRNAMGLHQVGVRPELCTRGGAHSPTTEGFGNTCWSEEPKNHEPTKVVARGGADVWSLIYHARPAQSPVLLFKDMDRDDDDNMMDSSADDSEEEVVVRLALDIDFGRHNED